MPEEVKTSEEVNAPDRNAGRLLTAYLIGLVSGGAAALLWAPRSGSETRSVVTEKARQSREKAAVAARQGRAIARRGADQVNKVVDTGRKAYRKALWREKKAA